MTPPACAARSFKPFAAIAALGCAFSLGAQSPPSLPPFLIDVQGQRAAAVAAAADVALAARIVSIVDKPQISPTGDSHATLAETWLGVRAGPPGSPTPPTRLLNLRSGVRRDENRRAAPSTST